MAQSKILLDSNTYFRLAKEIHPLLFQEFGPKRYCLYVLKELQDEYDRSPRLQTKFPWVDESEYKNNRCKPLSIGRKEQGNIETVVEFMWETVQTELPGPSRIDVRNLAHAYVLGIPIVTDDRDMMSLAKIYEVQTMSTLQLLKIMLDCKHVGIKDIRRIAAYWSWLGDLPGGFARNYRKLFEEQPPV